MNQSRFAAVFLSFVGVSLLSGEATALDDRNPLGAPLIPYRKVIEAPDGRFNDRRYNRLIDADGVLLPDHRARCMGDKLLGQDPETCARAPGVAKSLGCINEVERDWAVWAGLYVMCNPVFPHSIYQVCPCSCFSPETRILVRRSEAGEAVWSPADKVSQSDTIVALADGATMDAPLFEGREILYTTSGEEHAKLISLETDSGAILHLTQHHAVLLSDGRMVTAKELEPGNDLVDWQGRPTTIRSVKHERPGGMVYNVAVAGKPKTAHLILAEGVLVGDLLWQNSLGTELGEVAVRRGPKVER